MTAQYFYERLLGYKEESHKTGMWYYGYANDSVEIHRKNDEDIYYVIRIDGRVQEYLTNTDSLLPRNVHFVGDLQGDDFELYNTVQMLKTGYIVLNNVNSEFNVKKIITNLRYYIESFEDTIYPRSTGPIPCLCGGCCFSKGVTDNFTFYATNGIEIEIYTIRRLIEENKNRKYYDARVMPFKRKMDTDNSFYVTFTKIIRGVDMNDVYNRCKGALKELRKYLNEIDVKHKWVDMNIKYPIYH